MLNFSNASNFDYNTNFVEISSGRASLKEIDTDFSGSDFEGGKFSNLYLNETENFVINTKTDSVLDFGSILPTKKDNLVAYWRMDGDSTDSSGNENHLLGSQSFSTDSIVGDYSGHFNNSPYAYITNSSLMPTSKLTFSVWVKAQTAGNGVRIISSGYEGTNDTSFSVLVRNVSSPIWRVSLIQSDNTELTLFGATPVLLDTWTHLVVTADGSNINLYINGVFDRSLSYDGTIKPITTCWAIGARPRLADCTHKDQRWNGYIDEVILLDDSLDSDEVNLLFRSQSLNYTELSPSWTPHWNNIVAYWKMDGTWQDSSGNGNHGSANGDASFVNDSKVGSLAGEFDGSGDFTQISNSAELTGFSEFSSSFWIKLEGASSSSAGIIDKNRLGEWSIHLDRNFTNIVFEAVTTGGKETWTSSKALNKGEWYHVVIIYNSTDSIRKIYINNISYPLSLSSVDGGNIASTSNRLYLAQTNDSRFLSGKLDDVGLWSTGLSKSEVLTIYNRQKQKYAASYESPVIDLGAQQNITSLSSTSQLPFMKELTVNTESLSSYGDLNGDLSNSLLGYWPFNELLWDGSLNEVINHSNNKLHASAVGDANSTSYSLMGRAGQFDGDGDGVCINDSTTLRISGHYSNFQWINLSSLPSDSNPMAIFTKWNIGSNREFKFFIDSDNSLTFSKSYNGDSGGQVESLTSSYVFNESHLGSWHHIGFTYSPSGNVSFYLDGKVVSSHTLVDATIHQGTASLCIGKVYWMGQSQGESLNGFIDEVAF